MTDPEVLKRIDALLALVGMWIVLSMVLGSFFLMTINAVIGVLSLATVVLVFMIGAYSFLSSDESA